MNVTRNIKSLKRIAMSRPRKVIFDNDGSDCFKRLCQGNTGNDLIEVRAKPAIDGGVDTYIYTTGWGFGIGLHNSRVGSVLTTTEGHLAGNLVADYIRAGTDCLRIQSEYAKERGKEFFWGMRMNDTHDQGYGGAFMPENCFKNEHPDVMFGEDRIHGARTAVDYFDARVRDFAVAYIMDVVDRYEIDGIFLDFYRHPIFFRSNAKGQPATGDEVAAMTLFMRTVKTELDKRRAERGKYHLVAVRVPDSVEYCRAIGIDIENWLGEELADILFTTSYLQLNNWEYSAELGHRFGVPVYPSLDESRVRSELPRHKRNCVKGYYGRIMNVWEAGCDGVLMFNNSGLRDMRLNIEQNWFAQDAGSFQEALASTVKGRDHVNCLSKTYFISFRGIGNVAGGALPHQDYINIPTLNHHAPLVIRQNGQEEFPIRIVDDLDSATAQGRTPTTIANIFMLGDPDSVKVGINGTDLHFTASVNDRGDLDQGQAEYILTAPLPVSVLRRGENTFTFQCNRTMTLLDMWVDVNYPAF